MTHETDEQQVKRYAIEVEKQYNRICEIIKSDNGVFEKMGAIRACTDQVEDIADNTAAINVISKSLKKLDKILFGK